LSESVFSEEALGEKLGRLISDHGVPGAQLAVLDGDEVLEAAAGVLSLRTRWPTSTDALFLPGSPLVNAPVIGVLTVRTPKALRPKVMTAVLTVATIAGPLGFLAAGEALRHVSLSTFFVVLSSLMTLSGLAFAALLLRNSAAPDLVSMADVAGG
jgi:hypothetical protein